MTADGKHSNAEEIHIVVSRSWEFANAAARAAASGFVEDDEGKYALDLDTGAVWRLADYSGPTWAAVGLLCALDLDDHPGTFGSGDKLIVNVSGALYKVDYDDLPGAGPSGRTLLETLSPSGVSTISSSASLSGYQKIVIEFALRSTQAAITVSGLLQFNGDSVAGNYYSMETYDHGTASGRTGNASSQFTTGIAGASAPSNVFTIGKIEIPQYANTNFTKQAIGLSALRYDVSSVQNVQYNTRLHWNNVAAITGITIALSAGNFVSGSVIKIYGEN